MKINENVSYEGTSEINDCTFIRLKQNVNNIIIFF